MRYSETLYLRYLCGVIGLFYILLCWVAGNALAAVTGNYVPGNIIGMVLLFVLLRLKIVPARKVRPAAKFLLGVMALFFVPFGVGLMVSYDTLLTHFWAIMAALLASTLIVLVTVGWTFQKLNRKNDASAS